MGLKWRFSPDAPSVGHVVNPESALFQRATKEFVDISFELSYFLFPKKEAEGRPAHSLRTFQTFLENSRSGKMDLQTEGNSYEQKIVC